MDTNFVVTVVGLYVILLTLLSGMGIKTVRYMLAK